MDWMPPDHLAAASGGVVYALEGDTPDDAIVVDLRRDEESLNWTASGPSDSRPRFSEWSDELAHERVGEARARLRQVRSDHDADPEA